MISKNKSLFFGSEGVLAEANRYEAALFTGTYTIYMILYQTNCFPFITVIMFFFILFWVRHLPSNVFTRVGWLGIWEREIRLSRASVACAEMVSEETFYFVKQTTVVDPNEKFRYLASSEETLVTKIKWN